MEKVVNTKEQAAKPRRGFASMDASKLRAVSSKGGSATHAAARGFAVMDEERRREISRKGVEARRSSSS